MPTTVHDILQAHNLAITGTVKWGGSFDANYNGIYIISLSDNPNQNENLSNAPSFNETQMHNWLNTATEMKIDNENPTIEKLKIRLSEFWFEDENIVYIGKAEKQNIKQRINKFFRHSVGERSPHRGGFWIKLLENLSELNIYYVKIDEQAIVDDIEKALLKYFMENVTPESRAEIRDQELPLPFGNVEYTPRRCKQHGILKQCS